MRLAAMAHDAALPGEGPIVAVDILALAQVNAALAVYGQLDDLTDQVKRLADAAERAAR